MDIRKCSINDSQELLDMLLNLDKETKYMLFEDGERSTNIKFIENMINQTIQSNNLFLIAVEEGKIVGFLAVSKVPLQKIKHIGSIVIGIRKNFRGLGIGTKLFKMVDKWACDNDIKRLELTVITENEKALKLYQKQGFKIEGTREKAIYMDNDYFDEYYMAKLI